MQMGKMVWKLVRESFLGGVMTWLVSFMVQGDGNVQMHGDVSQALE